MTWLAVPVLCGAAYYLLALVAAARWNRRRPAPAGTLPPVSILKPVRGRDPRFYEAIRSHAVQDYPEFEILFATSDPADPALEDIRRLAAEFPARHIRVTVCRTAAPNGKVGLLSVLAAQARYPVLLINDSDIHVEPAYLGQVVDALEEPGVGLVTALYRGASASPAARAEAIGIATEFAPGILVARLLGSAGFALGSTMALRRRTFDEIGGFAGMEDLLADDYHLGARVSRAGYRIAFSLAVVETNLGAESWREAWLHQLRWSRTIRVLRPAGYLGSAIMHVTAWGIVAALAGSWPAAAAALSIRLLAGLVVGAGILGDRAILRQFYLIPLRDLFGFAVWAAGLFGSTVTWRGQRLRLSRDGRISPIAGTAGPRDAI